MSMQNKIIKNPKKSSKEIIFKVLRQISYTKLFKKYTSGKFSFSKISINHLIYNNPCQIVAKFKDFLLYDDNTEFIRRFYPENEVFPRLKKIVIFYETYSRIFPNYLVLKENKYLYRNIRKKQKMINAINEIKREEKENKKKLGIKNDKNDNYKKNELFTKKIKDEIKIFQKNLSGKIHKNSFDTDNQNDDDTLLINPNSISISVLNWKEFEKNNFDKENKENIDDSFINSKTNESITQMLSILNDNKIYIKDLPKIFMENKIVNIYPVIKRQKSKNNKRKIIKSKKIEYNKNEISKYAKTSSIATTSTSHLSRGIHRKNFFSNDIKVGEIEIKNDYNNTNIKSNEKKLILNKNIINNNKNDNNNYNINNKNIYQPMSPQIQDIKFRKKFFSTNNIFKNPKTPFNKNKERNFFEKKEIYSLTNTNTNINNNENINTKKIYRKSKRQSLDIVINNNSKNKENIRRNYNKKNFLTENNSKNIIICDNTNITKGKKIEENKTNANLKDILKNENKNKKIFNTAKKDKNKRGLLLNYTKNKTNSNIISKKQMKFYENKSEQNINSLANLNCNKIKFNTYRNKKDNNIPKQKTEEKNKSKKFITKDNKSITNPTFINEKSELAKINEIKSSDIYKSKIESLKKKAKISNLEKNNANNQVKTFQNNNNEIAPTHGNKSPKIKRLTPLLSNKLDTNSSNFSPNNNNRKRINTISNKEREKKINTFLNDKMRSKSNCNSYKNFIVLNRMKSVKNNRKNSPNNLNKDKLIKTHDKNNKKVELFKKTKASTSNNFRNTKIKERETQKDKNKFSYTIKVNKTYIKKKNNKNSSKEKSKTKEKDNKIKSVIKQSIK